MNQKNVADEFFLNLKEYDANIELWKHYDNLRQAKNGTFLTMNAVLVAALGALIGFGESGIQTWVIVALISVFGLVTSVLWSQILARNSEYIRFRRFQLRYLENKIGLGEMNTFTNQEKALKEPYVTISYDELSDDGQSKKFDIDKSAKKSSTDTDGWLAKSVGVFWILALLITGLVLINA